MKIKNLLSSFCLCALAVHHVYSDMTRKEFRAALATDRAVDACLSGMKSADGAIRRTALATLYQLNQEKGCVYAEQAMGDVDPSVRFVAINILGAHLTPERKAKLERSLSAESNQMNLFQVRHALWPFHRKNLLLKNDRSWDHLVKEKGRVSLATMEWFSLDDAELNGHLKKWYSSETAAPWQKMALSKGETVPVGKVRWYRVVFPVPAPGYSANAFEIFVGAAGTWDVWLNGIYLGNSSSNPEQGGFRLDASKEVQKEASNVLVLRASSSQIPARLDGVIDYVWEE